MKKWNEKTPEERLKDIMAGYELVNKESDHLFNSLQAIVSLEFKKIWDRISSVGENLDPWTHLKAPSEKTIQKAQSFIIDLYQLANEEGCWVYPLFINPTSEAEICLEFHGPKNMHSGKDVTFYINENSVTCLTAFNSKISDMEDGEKLKPSDATKLLKWMLC